MKAYSYTAKDQTGATTKGVIQAADRGAALAALKAKGLMPVSVAEGGHIQREVGLPEWFSTRTLALAGLATLVLGVALIGIKNVSSKPSLKTDNKKPKKTIIEKETNVTSNQITSNDVAPSIQQETVTVPSTPKEEKGAVIADGTKKRFQAHVTEELSSNQAATPPPPEYSTGTERVINMIVNARLGYPPPPLPMIPIAEDIEQILNNSIILYDDDTEEVAQRKANVAYAKQLLKAYLAEGGSVETFLSYYRDELKKAYVEWDAAQKHTIELFKGGDTKGALEYAKEQNKDFEARGIRQIYVPVGQ